MVHQGGCGNVVGDEHRPNRRVHCFPAEENQMKTHSQWQDEMASNGQGIYMRSKDIKAIQADALEHAIFLLCANANSATSGFNAIHRLMLKLRGAKKT
jgi:hypothetical protein